MVKNPPASAGDMRYVSSIPELERSSGVGNGKNTPVFLPGKSHGQRSLVGYSPWGCRELDTTKHTHTLMLIYTVCLQGGFFSTEYEMALIFFIT